MNVIYGWINDMGIKHGQMLNGKCRKCGLPMKYLDRGKTPNLCATCAWIKSMRKIEKDKKKRKKWGK